MERLPHEPYINAVISAITAAGHSVGPDTFTQYATHDGEVTLLEAFLDLGGDPHGATSGPGRAGLVWCQTTGWLRGAYYGRGQLGSLDDVFAGHCVLPTPASVAASVREPGGRPRTAAEDTAPAQGPLPTEITAALDQGDMTEDLAARLAAYWPQPH
ncbi:hypothetical protein FM076_32010 [Streptomyces albus subsp. chlorinus]|uniref:DUF6292 family protein n=1 Tax=Streptomyces albus TaxID=1888 RepID=UPI00156DC2E6|nr:DUF6292 family protein [Streptomyces albus]NSC25534.1 hypothetical protein [Streptomyces albus subsp. chlorinus]